MLRKVPPIAFPIKLMDFLQIFSSIAPSVFERNFAEKFNLKNCFALSSGRGALTIALKALKEIRQKKTDVIIPAYTCPTVALSVARAGLQVKLCDISSETLNIDVTGLENLIDDNTLCVVVPYIFGFPGDMDGIMTAVNTSGIFLIEDVAQAAGAKWRGRYLGEFGHLSCFSLGRGKSLTTYEGGVIGISSDNDSLKSHLERMVRPLAKPGDFHSLLMISQLLGMCLLQRPFAWWLISKLPLGFEQQYHPIDFKIERLENWQLAFGFSVLKRLDSINAQRIHNGKYLFQGLKDLEYISIPKELDGAQATYIRLPMIVKDRQLKENIYQKLSKAGISVSRMYVKSINRYDYLKDFVPDGNYPEAEYAADRILALPTHPLVKESDLRLIVSIIKGVAD